jgi:hypothetical protein
MTADGLELYFDSDRGASLCMWRATRASITDEFGAPVRQDQLCPTGQFGGPSISADGLTLVYNSSLDAVAEGDLYLSVRASRDAPFPPGAKLAGLPAMVGYPVLSADRLRIWFEEEIGPDLELVTAERISPSDNFTNLQGLTELDTGTGNVDISLTLDEAEVYFASNRGGDFDVWHASRPCL